MRKKLPILIALLTFSIGVVLSYSWSSRKRIEDFLVEILSPEPSRDKFVGLLDLCGPRFNSHQYLITTTGQTLEQTGESFDSAVFLVKLRGLKAQAQLSSKGAKLMAFYKK